MNHTRLIFVEMNFNGYYLLLGIRLLAYLAEEQCDLLAFMLGEMAFCSDHSPSHDCIGLHRSHMKKYVEFQCQHCLIRFKEYSGTERYADFTHSLHFLKALQAKKQKEDA